MTLNLVVLDLVGGEIDAATQRLMDTTQIKHQHIIDEHPHIVVTGEIKHHVLIVDFAIFRHIEIGPRFMPNEYLLSSLSLPNGVNSGSRFPLYPYNNNRNRLLLWSYFAYFDAASKL